MAVNNKCVDPNNEGNGNTMNENAYDDVDELEADHEYHKLNEAIENINNCLDALEQKNDGLQERIKELLRSNQQVIESQEATVQDP